jgi:flagellar biosynthetic protein FlhB
MSESKESFQDKSEEPTAKRKSQTRKEGNVAKSMEINSSLILITGLLCLTIWGGMIFNHIIEVDKFIFSQIGQIQITTDVLPGYLYSGFRIIVSILIPIMIPIVIVGILANILQFGWLFTLKTLKPKLDKLNPIGGFKKLLSKRSGVELLKNILKIIIIGWIGYSIVAGLTDEMIPLMDQTPWAIYLWICKGAAKVGFYIAFAIFILSIFDLLYQRWHHHDELKMTKQEVKDERRQSEGDPKVKAKIRQIQFKTAPNPTYIAIALKYDVDMMSAPTVIAKGKRLLAEKIRDIALVQDIPIVEEPPLARELYKLVEVGQEIPGNLYQAVAEILAYVYNLREENEAAYA